MSNEKGYKNRPESFYQPAKESDRTREGQSNGKYNGDGHDFNIKGKVTSNSGSDYHDIGRSTSGLHGNFAEKDASLEYLRNRNKDGQEVRHFSGTHEQSKLKIYGGVTAYDDNPIPEVYKPATSQGDTPSNAVGYGVNEKDRNFRQVVEQKTETTNLPPRIANHLKKKA